MQLSGKIDAQDAADIRRMMRSRWYWPRLLLANWYGTALLIVLLWATIEMLLGKSGGNWLGMGVLWLVIAGIAVWSVYKSKRHIERETMQLRNQLPDRITLANDGVRTEGPDGASGFQPWRGYKSWHEGERVWLVYRSLGSGFLILPVASLTASGRGALRGILQSSISAQS